MTCKFGIGGKNREIVPFEKMLELKARSGFSSLRRLQEVPSLRLQQ